MKITTRRAAGAGVLSIALLVAACGDQQDAVDTPSETTAAQTTGPQDGQVDQTHNDVDTMFAQMMIIHHEGAIEMADLALERADSAEVRDLAQRISAAQGPEIAEMTAWLEAWDEETTADEDMSGHSGMDMGGMSQDEAMTELEGLTGSDFDRRFLELMIAHHEGAVAMAEDQLADGQNPQALDLARKIIDDQQAEIGEMEELLKSL